MWTVQWWKISTFPTSMPIALMLWRPPTTQVSIKSHPLAYVWFSTKHKQRQFSNQWWRSRANSSRLVCRFQDWRRTPQTKKICLVFRTTSPNKINIWNTCWWTLANFNSPTIMLWVHRSWRAIRSSRIMIPILGMPVRIWKIIWLGMRKNLTTSTVRGMLRILLMESAHLVMGITQFMMWKIRNVLIAQKAPSLAKVVTSAWQFLKIGMTTALEGDMKIVMECVFVGLLHLFGMDRIVFDAFNPISLIFQHKNARSALKDNTMKLNKINACRLIARIAPIISIL